MSNKELAKKIGCEYWLFMRIVEFAGEEDSKSFLWALSQDDPSIFSQGLDIFIIIHEAYTRSLPENES